MAGSGIGTMRRRVLLALCASAAIGLCAPFAYAATFAARVNYRTGGGPEAVAVGDLDADGILDLVIANDSDGTVSVLLGSGGGRFAAKADFRAGEHPIDVAIADLNLDGRLDVAVVNRLSNSASVLLGKGDGTLQARLVFATGTAPESLAIADVNDDGRPDLLTANVGVGSFSVLTGRGTGAFDAHTDYATVKYPLSIAVADLNRDGNADVLTAGIFDGMVDGVASISFGTGTGSFGPNTDYTMGRLPRAIAVADFDADGDPDMVTAILAVDLETGAYFGVLAVRLGDGSGSFGAKTDYETGTYPEDVEVADIDGDGRLDLVSADYDAHTVSVLPGNGDGTFGARAHFALDSVGRAVEVGDFDRDARPDVAAVVAGNTVSIFMNTTTLTPSGSFGPRMDYPVGTSATPQAIALADVNRDGVLDAITADVGSDTVSLLPGSADGSFGSATSWEAGTDSGPSGIAAADVDEDGYLDLVFTKSKTDSIGVLLSNHLGGFAAGVLTFATGDNPGGLAIDDVDDDGNLDVVVTNYISGSVSVLLGDGAAGFAPKLDFAVGNFPRSVAIADLNRDGRKDLAVAGPNSNQFLSVLFGTGGGSFGGRLDLKTGVDAPNAVAIADANGDGHPDLVAANASSDVGILAGDGAGNFAPPVNYPTAYYPRGVALGDLNRDGMPDVVTGTYDTAGLSVLLGTGAGSLGARTDLALRQGTYAVAIADVNRDGAPDLVTPTYDSAVSVFLNTPPPVTDLGVTLLASEGTPAIGSTITFTGTVTNHGPNAAEGVTLTDTLPTGLELVSATSIAGECSGVARVTCGIGRLASGATSTVTIVTTVAATGVMANTVEVSGNAVDTVARNDSATVARVAFTDDPLMAAVTSVKAVHMVELRNAINAMRALKGLSAQTWWQVIVPGRSKARAGDLNAACSALRVAYATAPCTTSRVMGQTVLAADFVELRDAVNSVP